ncbi:MAG: PilN domain-containing protein [Kineosporiaceae bacterium]|nr:PilN domain-containing protein [Kineosporiaceae bacterium]
MTVTMPQAQEGSITRTRVEWATVPRVNLLPPEIIEARRFRRVQRLLGATVLGVVLLGLLGTFWAQHQVGTARAELAVVEARTQQLRAQEAQYAEVPTVRAQVDAARSARAVAMATDVLWYRFLDELSVATPPTVWWDTVDVALLEEGATPAVTDALAASGIGQVSVTGTAKAYPDVAQWLTSAAAVSGMDVTRLQSAEVSEEPDSPGLAFAATVTVKPEALSHRYDRKAD